MKEELAGGARNVEEELAGDSRKKNWQVARGG